MTAAPAHARLAQLLERLDFDQSREFTFKRRRWLAGTDGDRGFFTMRADGGEIKTWPDAGAAGVHVASMLGPKAATALANTWAAAWPTDARATDRVLVALRARMPFPWESYGTEVGALARQAWTEVLTKDPNRDNHALAFLAASPAEREQYVTSRAGSLWGSDRDVVLVAAKAAGFKVPKDVERDAVARLERREAAQAKRLGSEPKAVAPQPDLVRRLRALKALAARASKEDGGVHRVHTSKSKVSGARAAAAAEKKAAKQAAADERAAERGRAAVARAKARQEAKEAKARAKGGRRSADPAVCAAEAAERQARRELEEADRKALGASAKHAKALERTEKCRSGACKKGRGKRAACVAAATVGAAAQALQRANAVLEKARTAHGAALLELRRLHAPEPPAPKAAGVRPTERRATTTPLRSCGNVCHIDVGRGLCGGQATILLTTPQGALREVPTRFCLVEASALITSHDPQSFDVDPRYPAATQERRYDRDRAEQMKVVQIAQNPRPDLVFSTAADATSGTPIVTQDGESLLVLGGNGRTMGLRRHYRAGGTAFRDYLVAHAREFGFTSAQVKKFTDPVVVRVIEAPRDQWSRFVRDLNQTLTQSMDVITEGVSLARQMPAEVLDILADNVGDGDLPAFYESRSSLPLIHSLERAGVITTSNRNRILDPISGLLNDEGKALVTRQISAAVLPDADLLEFVGPQIRSTLARAAPSIIAAAAAGGEWDVRPPFARAARDLVVARTRDLSVKQFYRQVDFVDPPATLRHPMGLRLLVILDRLGGKPLVFSRVFGYFLSESRQTGGLFKSATPLATLDEAAKNIGKIDLVALVGELMR